MQETPKTGVIAPFHSVVLVEVKQGGGRINIITTLSMQGGRQEASLPETRCSRGCSKDSRWDYFYIKRFCWDNIQFGNLKSATFRSPKPVT